MTEREAPDTFEVRWDNGKTERIDAHQVTWPNNGLMSSYRIGDAGPCRIQFMARVDGKWILLLSAKESNIANVRNISKLSEPVSK